jgi:uncharacterized membrane protein YsdA (DUF1294 family)
MVKVRNMIGPASRKSPVRFHLLVALTLALFAAASLAWLLGEWRTWPTWLASWLIAVNLITFGYYGYDKMRSRQAGSRVPEVILHALAMVGGSPGALAAMHVFRHKTIKGPFRAWFWLIVVLQVVLLGWIVKMIWTG